MRQVRDLFVGRAALGDVLDHVEHVTGLAGLVADRQPLGGDDPAAAGPALPAMFVDEDRLVRLLRQVVVRGNPLGQMGWKQVVGRLADNIVARRAELLLGDGIDQHVAPVMGVLHRDLRRDVIDDLAQESVVAVAFLLELSLLGDVLDGCDPAARGQRLVDDDVGSSVRGLHDGAVDLAFRDAAHDRIAEAADVAVVGPGVLPVLDQVVIVQPGLHHVGRQIVHLEVALVEGDDARRCVVQDEPLRHVVERGVEPLFLGGEQLLRDFVLAVDLADDHEQDEGDHRGRACRQHDQETGLCAPVGKRRFNRVGGDDHDREMAQHRRGAETIPMIDRALDAERLQPALFQNGPAASVPT